MNQQILPVVDCPGPYKTVLEFEKRMKRKKGGSAGMRVDRPRDNVKKGGRSDEQKKKEVPDRVAEYD